MTRAFLRITRPWKNQRWLDRLLSCVPWRRGSVNLSGSGSEVALSAPQTFSLDHLHPDTSITVSNNRYHMLASPSSEEANNNVVLLGIRSRSGDCTLLPEDSSLSSFSSASSDVFGDLEMALCAEGLLEFRDSKASIPVLNIGYGFTDEELMVLSKPPTPYSKTVDWKPEGCIFGGMVGEDKLGSDLYSLEPLIDGLPASVWLECVEPTLSILVSLNSLRRRRSNLSLKKGVPEVEGSNRCRHGDFELGPIAIFHHPGRIQQMMLLRVEFLNAAATANANNPTNNPNNNINQSAEHNSRRGYNRHRRFRHAQFDEINMGHISDYYNESGNINGCNNNSSSSSSNNNNNNSCININNVIHYNSNWCIEPGMMNGCNSRDSSTIVINSNNSNTISSINTNSTKNADSSSYNNEPSNMDGCNDSNSSNRNNNINSGSRSRNENDSNSSSNNNNNNNSSKYNNESNIVSDCNNSSNNNNNSNNNYYNESSTVSDCDNNNNNSSSSSGRLNSVSDMKWQIQEKAQYNRISFRRSAVCGVNDGTDLQSPRSPRPALTVTCSPDNMKKLTGESPCLQPHDYTVDMMYFQNAYRPDISENAQDSEHRETELPASNQEYPEQFVDMFHISEEHQLLSWDDKPLDCTGHNSLQYDQNWNCNAAPTSAAALFLVDRYKAVMYGKKNTSQDLQDWKSYANPTKRIRSISLKRNKQYDKLLECDSYGSCPAPKDWKGRVKARLVRLSMPFIHHHSQNQLRGYEEQTSVEEEDSLNNNAIPFKASATTPAASSDSELGVEGSTSEHPADRNCNARPTETVAESPEGILSSLVIASAAVMLGTTVSGAAVCVSSAACQPVTDLQPVPVPVPVLCAGSEEDNGDEEEEGLVLEDGGDNELRKLVPAANTTTTITNPGNMAVPPPPPLPPTLPPSDNITTTITTTTTTHSPPTPISVSTTTTATGTTTSRPVDVLALGDHATWSLLPGDRYCYLPCRHPASLIGQPGRVVVSTRPWSARRHLLNYSRGLVRRARGALFRWRVRLERAKTSRASRDPGV